MDLEVRGSYPWGSEDLSSAWSSLNSRAKSIADKLSQSGAPETTLQKETPNYIPRKSGFLGIGSQPARTDYSYVALRPGGWRFLCRGTYHNCVEPMEGRPTGCEMRCDEVWLERDGSFKVLTIANYSYTGRQASVTLYGSVNPADQRTLLCYDITYLGGIIDVQNAERRAIESYRPHTGQIHFGKSPFQRVSEALEALGHSRPQPATHDLW